MNDKALSPHFSLFALTRTDQVDLQDENRHITAAEEAKLTELANLLESCQTALGCDIEIHSGRRYLELNKRVGGSERSQHLKCEAADFSPIGLDTEVSIDLAFFKLIEAAKAGKFKFGQAIVEGQANGREGRKVWIHISLGTPHRDAARCGEVLRIKDGKTEVITKIA